MPHRSLELRQTYAARIMRIAGVVDPSLEAAYAAVPREDFCGPPPWRVSGVAGLSGGERDIARLYDDVLVAIDIGRGINNGQPSLHAQCLSMLKLEEGDTVVQIGAGAGYYTAILASLVGPTGKVFAYEVEAGIAERASKNLAGYPQVEVRAASGVAEALPKADAIYVSAAASHPVPGWLDALKAGGRLVFPLQAANSSGAMLLVTRPGQARDAWPARLFSAVVFIDCEGAQDADIGRRLNAAFRRGGSVRVGWLMFGAAPPGEIWLQGDGWALTTDGSGQMPTS